MKKFLFVCIAATFTLVLSNVPTVNLKAQTVQKISLDTTTNTDTSFVELKAVPSGVVSVQGTAVPVSGTLAGKIYLYGTLDGVYVLLDSSATLSPTATTKIFTYKKSDGNPYVSFKGELRTSGTQRSFLIMTAKFED